MARELRMAKDKKKVLIIDDHPVFREGLSSLLRRESGLMVCGEVGDAQSGLAEAQRLKPDLVLVDIGLPGRNGLEFIKDLHAVQPAMAVLAVSMHHENLYAERVLKAGARGYIMKQEGPKEILKAIRQVLGGGVYLSGKMSLRVIEGFAGRKSAVVAPESRLTDREVEVLQLIGQANDTRAIAKLLHLSHKTVDAHRGRIKEKLELGSSTELIVYAAKWVEGQGVAGE